MSEVRAAEWIKLCNQMKADIDAIERVLGEYGYPYHPPLVRATDALAESARKLAFNASIHGREYRLERRAQGLSEDE